jgi:diguanylate cyclase (GGDEF)-like protein
MKPSADIPRVQLLEQARELVLQDSEISAEEKEAVVKLVQALIEASETTRPAQNRASSRAKLVTQEFITKYSLINLVRQQADELDSLKKLSLNLTSSLDLQTVLDAVVAEAMRLVENARTAHIFLCTSGKLEFGAALNSEGVRNQVMAIPRPNGLTAHVANHGRQIVVEDIRNHPIYQSSPPAWEGSIIGLPLVVNKTVVGVMNLSRSTVGGFTPAETRLLELLADQAAVAISNASLHQMVTQQANSDILTGLPNRRALDERLEHELRYAQRTNTQFGVIMMDLDGFKAVNDTHGHVVGDEVLRSAFKSLAGTMRASDFLARYGGDELTLILHQADVPVARLVSDKIQESIRAFTFVTPSNDKIQLGVSGGIAIYPLHAKNSADLLRAADAALYHAKKYQRGTFVIAKGYTGPLDATRGEAPRE